MDYWIQNSDFSLSIEAPVKSPQTVIDAFNNYNWGEQLELQKELELEGRHSCPPGLGVVRRQGTLLHLIPNADKSAWGHSHTRKQKKLLGLIPSTKASVFTFDTVKPDQIPNIISRFINGDDEWLEKTLRKKD